MRLMAVRNNLQTSGAYMQLTAVQQADLISASNAGVDKVDAVIQKLKRECPNAFHTDNTLPTRVFFHRPADETPCVGFVRGRRRNVKAPSKSDGRKSAQTTVLNTNVSESA